VRLRAAPSEDLAGALCIPDVPQAGIEVRDP